MAAASGQLNRILKYCVLVKEEVHIGGDRGQGRMSKIEDPRGLIGKYEARTGKAVYCPRGEAGNDVGKERAHTV
jgi:hypothetical protein